MEDYVAPDVESADLESMHLASHGFEWPDHAVSHMPSSTSMSSQPPPLMPVDGRDHTHDIAIVGFSFVFPGAETTSELWDVMLGGRCVATEFPSDRLNSQRYYKGDGHHPSSIPCKKASFLSRDVAHFDAQMFSMTAGEAASTDPQQRLLLETTYRALENAGIPLSQISGTNTSVHTGCFTFDYAWALAKDPEYMPKYAAPGGAVSMLSNRISTFFNLSGPSVTVDTACSSSLVALDQACRCIRQGESSMGIVAGCSLLLTQDMFFTLGNMGFLSPDGVSHSFDARGNGYGRGEGVAVMILKPVAAALRDGDTIRAVIRNTFTNQNGLTPLAVPSKELQQRLIQETYREAGIDMSKTRFFEAHGTGTAVGDPLEAMAIGNSFRLGRSHEDPVIVGAIKANVGHLEGAAGIAGVIKAVLVLERGLIPPIAELASLNADIDAEFLKLHFPREAQSWPRQGLRRASVNSFGFGGTNAHAILDDANHYLEDRGLVGNHCTKPMAGDLSRSLPRAPDPDHVASEGTPKLFVFSGHDPGAVGRIMKSLQAHLEGELRADDRLDNEFLAALAHTLSHRRSLHSWRVSVTADTVPNLIAQLAVAKPTVTRAWAEPKVGFVFTGQGAQWVGMGRELAVFPVFRDSVLAADSFLRSELGCAWSVAEILLPSDSNSGSSKDTIQIAEPRYAQPLCTVLQVALVEVLRLFGLSPSAVVGHSSGEIAAAYAVGAMNRESVWKVAYFRGVLSSKIAEASAADEENWPRGGMMAVGLSEDAVRPYVDSVLRARGGGVVGVACINSPRNVTISGDLRLVEALQAELQKENVFARLLKVPVAYHSPHMERLASQYRRLIGVLSPGVSPPRYAIMVSSVTGQNVPAEELRKADYWVRNMVSPVRFSDAVSRLCRNAVKKERKKLDLSHRESVAVSDLLEVGPHSTLQGPIREVIQGTSSSLSAKVDIAYASALVRGRPAGTTFLEAIGQLHCSGHTVDLGRVNRRASGVNWPNTVLSTLPEYPFDHSQRYWSEPRVSRNMRMQSQRYTEYLGAPVPDYNPLEPRWRNMLRTSTMPWIGDHVINGECLFPAAGMVVMAVEAMAQILRGADKEVVAYEVCDMEVLAALTLPADEASGVETQLALRPWQDPRNKESSSAAFTLFSISGDDLFTEVCRGTVKVEFARLNVVHDEGALDRQDEDLRARIAGAAGTYGTELDRPAVFKKLWDNGYQFGPSFRGIEWTRRDGTGRSVTMVGTREPEPMAGTPAPSIIHPVVLDRILQTTLLPVARSDDAPTGTWVPTFIPKIRLPGNRIREETVQVLTVVRQMSGRLCNASAQVLGNKSCIVSLQGLELTMVSADELAGGEVSQKTYIKRLCYDMLYKPDVGLLDAQQLSGFVHSPSSKSNPGDVNSFAPLECYIDLLAHKNPGMRILQIGARMDATTKCILGTLVQETPNGTFSRFAQYDLTDPEQTELDDVTLLLGSVPKMQACVFDSGLEPATQGFADSKYDLVMVSNPNACRSLIDVRKFIKDDGKLIITDSGVELESISYFQAEGFEVELKLDCTVSTVLAASASASRCNKMTNGTLPNAKTALVITGWADVPADSRLTEPVVDILEGMGLAKTRRSHFHEVAALLKSGAQQAEDLLIVVVQDGDWLSLDRLKDDEYAAFQTTLTHSKNLLWLGDRAPSLSTTSMPFGAAHGLARALRVERPGMIFATAAVDTSSGGPTLLAVLTKTLQNFVTGSTEPDGHRTYERELLQVGDTLQIPRIYEANKLNTIVHEATLTTAVERRVRYGDQNLKLKVRRPGLMDTLCLETAVRPSVPLGPDEIEVEVRSVGINFRDCLIALGRVDEHDLGMECAGVVRAAGEACTSVRLGDRVMVCQAESFVGTMRCPEGAAHRIPDSMSLVDAGALPTIFVTAWYGLVRVARLARGESILIHSGAGGTGQAAIQVALHCGAEVYTTTGTAVKRKLLTELYGIPPERILNSRDLSFSSDVRRLTGDRGVDVVLNSLAGDALVASWECVAPWGRFLEIGKKDILSHNKLPMYQFKRNVSFSAIDISAMIRERPGMVREALGNIVPLFEGGVLRMPSPMKRFPISEVEQAFRYLQTGSHAGKVVVEMSQNEELTAFVTPKPKQCSFSGEQTFLIAGGLGAQGRVIARWMVDKGARHLVLLSRSGGRSSEQVAAFVEDLRSRDVEVYCPPCSIANPASLGAVLEHCKVHMPPIKGCIQAAMDLRDSVFENMTSEAWFASLQPKVAGTWNLHRQLPDDLDFFVMFSSISGIIGSPGQTNYAAGNAFQDALARHRVQQGKKTISLDFSLMAGHGYAVENRDAAVQFIKTRLVMEMTQSEILAILDMVCHREFMVDGDHAQIVMGLELPADIARRGVDGFNWLNEPLFSNLHQVTSSSGGSGDGASGTADSDSAREKDVAALVAGAASLAEAGNAVAVALADKLCKVLSLARESFDVEQPLHVYGVDSLIAVEMRNWFQQKLKVDIAVFEILGGATSTTLGRTVAEKLRPAP